MDFTRDLRDVLQALEREGVTHMVVGGLALEALGIPRATVDVDIQVSVPEPPSRARSVLYGCIVEEWSRDEVFGQETLIGHVGASGIPVEFFFTSHWFTRQALERRQRVHSPSLAREVPIPTPEDFVLLKACYLGSAHRSRAKLAQDALDIEGVVAAFPLDKAYVQTTAERLGAWGVLSPLLRME